MAHPSWVKREPLCFGSEGVRAGFTSVCSTKASMTYLRLKHWLPLPLVRSQYPSGARLICGSGASPDHCTTAVTDTRLSCCMSRHSGASGKLGQYLADHLAFTCGSRHKHLQGKKMSEPITTEKLLQLHSVRHLLRSPKSPGHARRIVGDTHAALSVEQDDPAVTLNAFSEVVHGLGGHPLR